jgi:two-component system, sensor histidine kinase
MPEPSAADGPVRGRFVAVDEGARAQDGSAIRREERHAIQRRLHDAAWVAAFGQLSALGLGLLASVAWIALLAVVSMQGHGPALAASELVLIGLAVPLIRARQWSLHPAIIVSTVALAAAILGLQPWLVSPDQRVPVSVWVIAISALAAATLAMRPGMAGSFAITVMAACIALDPSPGWQWPLTGALLIAAGSGVVVQLRRRWRKDLRSYVELSERLVRVGHERDAALRTDHEKSRFLAIASHDLRQPVHALGLFAATLQRRLHHSADEPVARNLVRAVDGLERSFNALLDISKLDAGAIAPRLETFPLRDMFRRLHMQYAGQAEFAGRGLRLSPGGKSVTSDPYLLERIASNLIHNAIKYTTRGGIAVVARSTASCINIEIWDTGRGMAPDELPRIFEEFYQVGRGERDRTHGLGMGLAIVKRLAALLGHRLEVASTLGRGTMFRIGVPIGGLPGIQEELAPADTQPFGQTEQMILVVDDEEPIREGLRLLLQEWGFGVMTAADAAQAEQAVSALEGRVDLVLTDLHLGPGPNGVDVIGSVRRLCGREVPAILVTGDAAPDQVQQVALTGDPVLFKPVQPRRLFEALNAALR